MSSDTHTWYPYMLPVHGPHPYVLPVHATRTCTVCVYGLPSGVYAVRSASTVVRSTCTVARTVWRTGVYGGLQGLSHIPSEFS